MADPRTKLVEVACPCCGATLQIDPETAVVITHKAVERAPLIEDLAVAAQQLKSDAERRNEIFEKSFASHRSGEKIREKKFEELLKLAKEDTSGAAPKRPFDLD